MSKAQGNVNSSPDESREKTGAGGMPDPQVEAAGRLSANQAFTLACTTGFIPAALVVLVTFMITRSWQAVAIAGALMLIALLAFSNLVAYVARRKTMKSKK